MASQKIIDIINNCTLPSGDKVFLLERVKKMNPLEALKLGNEILAGEVPFILADLHKIRTKLDNQENPKAPTGVAQILDSAINSVFTPKAKAPVSLSILENIEYLGTPIAPVPTNPNIQNFAKLSDFEHLSQIAFLSPEHFVSLDELSNNQLLKGVLDKLDKLMESIENVDIRRGYYLMFLQSKLFSSYISTGLTALRHPEYQPAEAILNLLHQLEAEKYLDNRQFQAVAILSSHLRTLCHF